MTNSKSTKRALLTSVLVVFMCVAMLIGTTFAWFTDTASTAVSKIQSGTLDVALEMKDASGNWVSAEGETLYFNNNETLLWEPGQTNQLSELRVVNKGNLALKYKVVISGIEGDAKLNEAIEWTIDGASLDEERYLLPEETSEAFVISGHMKETAGNEYQGLTIDGIAITVYATQYTYEYDMTDDQYDKDATYLIPWDGTTKTEPATDDNGVYHITNANEFASFITTVTAGGKYCHQTISIDSNIDLGGATIETTAEQGNRQLDGVKINGNGYTISNFVLDSTANPEGYYGGLFGYMAGYHDSYIKDLTVRNATVIGGKQTGVIIGGINGENSTVENCKVYDSVIIGTKKVGAVVGYTANGIVTDCYAENCTVYCAEDDENEAGEVVGFINTVDTGCVDNTSDLSSKNVSVNVGETPAVVSSSEEIANAAKNGGDIVLTDDIELTEALTITEDITIDGKGNTISGSPVSIQNADSIVIKNVVFDGPDNANGNASNLYIGKSVKNIVIENCTFKNTQWDSMQITPVEGVCESITINNCTFEISESAERFIHIEVSNGSACTAQIEVNITNNTFGSSADLRNDIIGIYGVDEDCINYGGNNTFADENGTVWIGWTNNTYANNQADVYAKLTGN